MKKKSEWKIGKARYGYYIYNNHLHMYLHKNLTLHDNCGIKNFWSTYKKALSHLNYWKNIKNINELEFITKDEMTV